MEISILKTREDIEQMLVLQAENLEEALSANDVQQDGFLTVKHDLALMEEMVAKEPQVIIKDQGKIVAYVLAMPRSMRNAIPILIPFFDQLDLISYQQTPLKNCTYVLNGQVCVARSHRGKGTFDMLLRGMQHYLSEKYQYCVTEIAHRNARSIRAHERVGFQTIDSYTSPEGEHWSVVLWDWQK